MSTLEEQAAKLAAMQSGSSGGGKQAPEESGVRLCAIKRGDDEELRVNFAEYNERHFVNVRLWKEQQGQYWPTKKGLSIRLHELPEFCTAMSRAMDMAIQEADK